MWSFCTLCYLFCQKKPLYPKFCDMVFPGGYLLWLVCIKSKRSSNGLSVGMKGSSPSQTSGCWLIAGIKTNESNWRLERVTGSWVRTWIYIGLNSHWQWNFGVFFDFGSLFFVCHWSWSDWFSAFSKQLSFVFLQLVQLQNLFVSDSGKPGFCRPPQNWLMHWRWGRVIFSKFCNRFSKWKIKICKKGVGVNFCLVCSVTYKYRQTISKAPMLWVSKAGDAGMCAFVFDIVYQPIGTRNLPWLDDFWQKADFRLILIWLVCIQIRHFLTAMCFTRLKFMRYKTNTQKMISSWCSAFLTFQQVKEAETKQQAADLAAVKVGNGDFLGSICWEFSMRKDSILHFLCFILKFLTICFDHVLTYWFATGPAGEPEGFKGPAGTGNVQPNHPHWNKYRSIYKASILEPFFIFLGGPVAERCFVQNHVCRPQWKQMLLIHCRWEGVFF